MLSFLNQHDLKTTGQASNWARTTGSSVLFSLLFYSLGGSLLEPRVAQTHHVAKDTRTSDLPTSTSDMLGFEILLYLDCMVQGGKKGLCAR